MVAARALAAALAVWAALLMPTGAAAESSSAMEKQELRQEGVRMLIAPNSPLNVQAVPDFNTMSLSLPLMRVTWDPPTSGPSPLAYKVYVNDKLTDTVNAGSWTQSKLTNLVIGTRYKFSVTAVNADGESPPVDVYQVAVVMPDSVRNVQAVPGDGWIDVYWDAPLDDGGAPIGQYFINGWIPRLNQSETRCDMTGPTSCRMPTILNGEVYDITVFAQNSVFMLPSGSQQQVEALATGLPSGPRRFRVVSGGGYTVTLAWDPPLEPGPEPILGYEISWLLYLHGTQNPPYFEPFQAPWVTVRVPPSALTHQVTDLTPGYNWRFAVQAYTATSIGSMTNGPLYIAEPHYQTLGVPGQPSNVGIMGMGTGAVKLKWEAPGADGNAAIKFYRITLTPVAGDLRKKRDRKPIVVECTADGSDPQCDGEYIVSGLKNGNQYSVAIAAKNRFGYGRDSVDDPTIRVMTEPNPPGKGPAKQTWKKNAGRRRDAARK